MTPQKKLVTVFGSSEDKEAQLFIKPHDHFVLNIDKPAGMGSSDVVRIVKRCLRQLGFPKGVKIGHLGTLDPFATGVLLIAINGATRLADLVHARYPKTYYAEGLLGVETDTGDCDGKVIGQVENTNTESKETKSNNLNLIGVDLMDASLNALSSSSSSFIYSFFSDYWQRPPAFSAAKYQGRPLYELARAGEEIPLKEAKKRFIYSLKILGIEERVAFRATVSSGTYIRVLFQDMAYHLFDKNVGHLRTLRRESIGPFDLSSRSSCLPLDLFMNKGQNQNEGHRPSQALSDFLETVSHNPTIPIEKVFPLPVFVLDDENLRSYQSGRPLLLGDYQPMDHLEMHWMVREDGVLLGLASIDALGHTTIHFNLNLTLKS